MSNDAKRRATDLLADLRDVCEETLEHAADMDEASFMADRAQQRILERTVELIGEVSIRLQQVAPELDLPWGEMRAMRDLLAHAYHRVDAATVWRTVQEDVPDVLERLDGLE